MGSCCSFDAWGEKLGESKFLPQVIYIDALGTPELSDQQYYFLFRPLSGTSCIAILSKDSIRLGSAYLVLGMVYRRMRSDLFT